MTINGLFTLLQHAVDIILDVIKDFTTYAKGMVEVHTTLIKNLADLPDSVMSKVTDVIDETIDRTYTWAYQN